MLRERGRSFSRYGGGVAEASDDLTFEIPDELYRRLQARAARHGKTAEEFVRDLIEEIATRLD